MSYVSTIFQYCWSLFELPLNFGDFTISFGNVFLFSLLVGFVCIAIFKYLWG